MPTNMRPTLLLFAILFSSVSLAQVFPVQVTPQLIPPYSPYLTDYTAPGARHLMVQIRANDMSISNYACKLRITIEGVGIRITTKSNAIIRPLIVEGGGIPQVLYGDDLHEYFHPNALDFSGLSRSEYGKSARLPEGVYRFTVEVLDFNRGTVVSNAGSAVAWIMLNDPPILNTPANFSKPEVTDPTNILFTWTPRHSGSPNAAFTTEYTFRLVEIWPEERNPYDALLTQQPLYETTTTQNNILYGVAEPALIPGRKYAWQVEARDDGGKDLFRNGGRSEVFTFQFGEALAVPENFQLRWAKPTTLSMRWQPVVVPGEEVKYRLQYRPLGRREGQQWYETRTKFTEKTLYHLQSDTEYEMRVRSEMPYQESAYTPIRVFRTLPATEEAFVCTDVITPPPPPANSLPVFPLGINDTLHAGGYDILVRDVMEVEGKYFGSGVAIVPWFNGAKVRVTFENIRVNDRYWLTRGTVKSVWNADSQFLVEEQTPVLPGLAPQTGEFDITIVAADSLIAVEGSAIAAVTRNETGNIVVTTTDGKEKVLPKGESYAIVDEVGNGYVVDQQGNIAKTTATEARSAATRGGRKYDLNFRFARGHGKYGYDERKYDALSRYYQQLEDGSYVAWKALSSAGADDLEGALESGDIEVTKIRFQAGAIPVIPLAAAEGKVRLSVPGAMAGMQEELIALYSAADTLPEKIVGKLNLVTYNPAHYNLEIVPVNGASLPVGLSAETISARVNEIFGQAVVTWHVHSGPGINVDLPEKFDEGETGVFSNYTADMKKVLNAYGRLQDNTYYLFLIQEPRDPASLGYMPRNKRAGFVFVAPHQGDHEAFVKTIAHELGHGAFNLKHPFSEHNLAAGATDNVMDYSDGTALYKYQWDLIHSPQGVIGLFEGDADGGSHLPMQQFASRFNQTFGGPPHSNCEQSAIARGSEVYNRSFNLQLAMYSGFLRLLLCETEKENCKASSSPYICGFINGLLQEFDWITTLESVEGWNVDAKEILTCALNSIPIGTQPDDNLNMGSILFKCLMGIEIKDLNEAIKDFIVANYDDPYYQGQATAFAITLLSPFKAKLLAKLATLPRFAKKISGFKELSKAKNADELVAISKSLSNLIDDSELEKLTKGIKYLPGPLLPPKIAATFTNSVYTNRKLLMRERYFKYHGENNRTGKKYTWVVNKKYATEKQLREELAIREDWNVEIKYISEFEVPAGIWVSEGKAASQGIGYPGGEYQAVILNVPKTWILKTTKAFDYEK